MVLPITNHVAGCGWIPFSANPVSSIVLEDFFYLVEAPFHKMFLTIRAFT